MSNGKKSLGVVALLAIYVIIAVVGFLIAYYIKVHFLAPKTAPQPTPTQAPVKSGMKVYQNTDDNFSVQYPQDMQIKKNSVGFGVNTVELRTPDNTDTKSAPDIQILTVPKTIAKTIGQDFDAYYSMADNTSKTIQSPVNGGNGAQQFTKVRNREINGLRAIDYSSVPSPNPDKVDPEIGTFVEVGSNMVIFATGQDNRDQLEEVLKTFDYTK